jgi:DNA-binding NarL/FixJ family response regulator
MLRLSWDVSEIARTWVTRGPNAEPTVKAHMGRILARLGARGRLQLVVIAHISGLA